MKLTVERDLFAELASDAMRASGKVSPIPIINNLLLDAANNTLTIVGTSLDAWYSARLPAEMDGVGKITVPGAALCGIVNGMPKGSQLIIEWSHPKDGAIIRCGRSRYKLLSITADDFPDVPLPDDPVTFEIPSKALVAALTATRFAISDDKSRVYLHGIYMHAGSDQHPGIGGNKDPRLVFVATDSREFARVSIPLPEGAADVAPVILPDLAIPEIIRIASDHDGMIKIEATENLVAFTAGDSTFITKLINATFPEYMRVIPTTSLVNVVVDGDELAAALQRLMVVANKSNTRTEITETSIRFSVTNPDVGSVEETIETDVEGGPLELHIKPVGFLNILKSIPTDRCTIKMTTPKAPVLFIPINAGPGDGMSRIFLSMPMEF